MQERIDLVVVAEERRKAAGLSVSVVVSVILHTLLLVWFIRSYSTIAPTPQEVPITRYIELMKQNPREFTEAPGPEVERAPVTAPFSDRNRRASMPEPTGDQPTKRPGEGGSIYTPPTAPAGPRGPQPQQASAPSQPAMAQNNPTTAATMSEPRTPPPSDASLIYREPTKAAAAAGIPDWRKAIQDAGRAAVQGGGGEDIDLARGGGDPGFAEQGPLSFETQWYDWGDYAQNMVSRIRVNWYANMPQLIRMGVKGVVTIRFTIQRDGRITDITTLSSSGHPPYDQAARKAIELSSPLKPLPADFPNPNERVTCMFYYNMEIPRT